MVLQPKAEGDSSTSIKEAQTQKAMMIQPRLFCPPSCFPTHVPKHSSRHVGRETKTISHGCSREPLRKKEKEGHTGLGAADPAKGQADWKRKEASQLKHPDQLI